MSFEVFQDPDVEFLFNSVQDYQTGLLAMNAMELRITSTGTNWDLYVGAITSDAGIWDVIQYYSVQGDHPTIDIVELRFRNTANTAQVQGYFPLTDINSPTYIIGSPALDPAVDCLSGAGANVPGDYLTNPSCYQFRVDMRITPGFEMRPGLYRIIVEYVIVADL
ncbi:MAG: hypothetical protein ACOCX0_04830 [Bacteroidota bacterium]